MVESTIWPRTTVQAALQRQEQRAQRELWLVVRKTVIRHLTTEEQISTRLNAHRRNLRIRTMVNTLMTQWASNTHTTRVKYTHKLNTAGTTTPLMHTMACLPCLQQRRVQREAQQD